jgi:hypothetical protein
MRRLALMICTSPAGESMVETSSPTRTSNFASLSVSEVVASPPAAEATPPSDSGPFGTAPGSPPAGDGTVDSVVRSFVIVSLWMTLSLS